MTVQIELPMWEIHYNHEVDGKIVARFYNIFAPTQLEAIAMFLKRVEFHETLSVGTVEFVSIELAS